MATATMLSHPPNASASGAISAVHSLGGTSFAATSIAGATSASTPQPRLLRQQRVQGAAPAHGWPLAAHDVGQ